MLVARTVLREFTTDLSKDGWWGQQGKWLDASGAGIHITPLKQSVLKD